MILFLFAIFRGVKVHRNAKSSVCKSPRLEAELRQKMGSEPENPEAAMRLIGHLQTDGPPRGRIVEAYNLCLSRQRDWKSSEDWQMAILELCHNFKVRNCVTIINKLSSPVFTILENNVNVDTAYFSLPLCFAAWNEFSAMQCSCCVAVS